MALTYTPSIPDLKLELPNFSLLATDGKTYTKNDFILDKNTGKSLEKPLVVMFICNHCPYVKAIEDRLITLALDLKKINVNVVAICSNDENHYPEDNYLNLKKRAEEKNYPFVYLQDKTQEIAKLFGAVCTPDFFVYDNQNHLTYRGRLDDSWKNPELVKIRELYEAVLELAQGLPISRPQTPSMGCSIKWSKPVNSK